MKKFLKKLLVSLFVLAIISFALPRTADGQEEIRAPHTVEEILIRQQDTGKLQQQGECGEVPPEYAEKVAFIERARTFTRGLGVSSDDMYKCYDPAPETSLQIYVLSWVPEGMIYEDRGRTGWLSGKYDPRRGLYVNVWGKNVGEWNTFSLPDMSEEEMAEFRSRLVEEGNAWYGRWTSTSTKKALEEELLRLPLNKIVEDFIHESCHDFFTSRGMTEIHNRAELEEPLCTVYGFRAGMAFLATEGQTTERQILEGRYRWSLERALWLNRLWWQLTVAFDGARTGEERIRRQEEVLAGVSREDRLKYVGIMELNTAIISSIRTYTLFFPAAVELWELLTGEPPIDMNPPPPEDVGGISPLPHRKTTTLSASHRQRFSFPQLFFRSCLVKTR